MTSEQRDIDNPFLDETDEAEEKPGEYADKVESTGSTFDLDTADEVETALPHPDDSK